MDRGKRAQEIRRGNDGFRRLGCNTLDGRVMLTSSVARDPNVSAILAKVMAFNAFTKDNDPYGEHDFGEFEIEGERFMWKIDYYDEAIMFGVDPYS